MKEPSSSFVGSAVLVPISPIAIESAFQVRSRDVAEYVPLIFAADSETADLIRRTLDDEGILTLVQSDVGVAGLPRRRIPILVPEEWLNDASAIVSRIEKNAFPICGDDDDVFDDDDEDDYDDDMDDYDDDDDVFDDDDEDDDDDV